MAASITNINTASIINTNTTQLQPLLKLINWLILNYLEMNSINTMQSYSINILHSEVLTAGVSI